jgi:hypothetical protein
MFYTGNTSRWGIVTDAVAETGTDAGSDFHIKRYSDSGSALTSAMTIVRKTGDVHVAYKTSTATGLYVHGPTSYLQITENSIASSAGVYGASTGNKDLNLNILGGSVLIGAWGNNTNSALYTRRLYVTGGAITGPWLMGMNPYETSKSKWSSPGKSSDAVDVVDVDLCLQRLTDMCMTQQSLIDDLLARISRLESN